MKKDFLLIACLLFLLEGCRQASKQQATDNYSITEDIQLDNTVTRIKIDNFDPNSVLKYSEVFEEVNFVRLETTDNCLIGRVDRIVTTENKGFIFDCFFSKVSGNTKTSAVYFNDMRHLSSSRGLFFMSDDLLISPVDPETFVRNIALIKKSKNSKKDLNEVMYDNMYPLIASLTIDKKLKDNILEILKSTKITVTEEEIYFNTGTLLSPDLILIDENNNAVNFSDLVASYKDSPIMAIRFSAVACDIHMYPALIFITITGLWKYTRRKHLGIYSNLRCREWKDTESIKRDLRELIRLRDDYVLEEFGEIMNEKKDKK